MAWTYEGENRVSRAISLLGPMGLFAAMTAAAGHANATTTQTFDLVGANSINEPVSIGDPTADQYGFIKSPDQVYFLATNGNALINPVAFSQPGLPSSTETFVAEPDGLQLQPSLTVNDVYYHLEFDLNGQRQVGFADFSQDTSELYSVTYGSAAPEPATWAELLLGVGAVGCVLRSTRSRRQSQVIA